MKKKFIAVLVGLMLVLSTATALGHDASFQQEEKDAWENVMKMTDPNFYGKGYLGFEAAMLVLYNIGHIYK